MSARGRGGRRHAPGRSGGEQGADAPRRRVATLRREGIDLLSQKNTPNLSGGKGEKMAAAPSVQEEESRPAAH